jgi:hypothetical protein
MGGASQRQAQCWPAGGEVGVPAADKAHKGLLCAVGAYGADP